MSTVKLVVTVEVDDNHPDYSASDLHPDAPAAFTLADVLAYFSEDLNRWGALPCLGRELSIGNPYATGGRMGSAVVTVDTEGVTMTLSNPFAGLAPSPAPRRAPLSVVELREAATAALAELMRVTERAGWDVATDLDVNRATSDWIECQGRYHRALVDSAKRHGDDTAPDA